ncbi:MAG: tetraacyldisaccharide 4'-kinase [Gammaproteobacteria bacterium]|nr:tetraacyldisaccharide 4'-kinase [Gammaproteobacteria bacterium]
MHNTMNKLTQFLYKEWYHKPKPSGLLRLCSAVYRPINKLLLQQSRKKRPSHFPIPVIVVGNLTVGGTGKTPTVIALYEYFSQRGLKAAIVTRAYKNTLQHFPHQVSAQDTASTIGDEALLLYQKTKAPIWIAKKRLEALKAIQQLAQIDIIISDDGLQHLAMPRALECVLIDGTHGFGNGYCLPAGPLREDISRLATVDFIIINGSCKPSLETILSPYLNDCHLMQLNSNDIYPLNPEHPPFQKNQYSLAAFAGIGHPDRFFTSLSKDDILFTPYPFQDHHHFVKKDFDIPETCIIMTEKDAVKCRGLTDKVIYVLPVKAVLPEIFWQKLHLKLSNIL